MAHKDPKSVISYCPSKTIRRCGGSPRGNDLRWQTTSAFGDPPPPLLLRDGFWENSHVRCWRSATRIPVKFAFPIEVPKE